MNDLFKYLHHKWVRRSTRWYPMLAVFYLTYRCDFRCCYCSDGSRTPYFRLATPHLPGHTALSILKAIRRHTAHVVITGGEPLHHPDIAFVLKQTARLRFREVILTTNGNLLHRYLPAVAAGVTSLVVSIDTLNPVKADAINGTPAGTFDGILRNIDLATRYRYGAYRMFISSVVTPTNILDLYDVYEFCKARRFVFAACPQLEGVNPHPELRQNVQYRAFYDFLIREKRNGGLINGTLPYLETMRDLERFTCRPFTMLTVSPEGEVFYPCLEIGKTAGNLLHGHSLHHLRRMGERRFGPPPACGNQCHSACALSFSVLLEQPAVLLQEGLLAAKRLFRRNACIVSRLK